MLEVILVYVGVQALIALYCTEPPTHLKNKPSKTLVTPLLLSIRHIKGKGMSEEQNQCVSESTLASSERGLHKHC
jgi:hypothetical protein